MGFNAFLTSSVFPATLVLIANFAIGYLPEKFKVKLQSLAIALAFLFGYLMLLGRPEWPPLGGVASLPWVALICGLFVLVSPMHKGSRYLIRAFFVAAILAILLWSVWASIRTNPMGYRNLAAFFCLGLGIWSILERAAESVQKPALILLPTLALTATSFLFLMEGSASLSQVSASMAVILAGQFALSLFFPKSLANTALLPFLSIFVIGTMVVGHFFSGINPWRSIMMSWPFFILWFRGLIPFVPKKPIPEAVVLAILAVAPLIYWLFNIYNLAKVL